MENQELLENLSSISTLLDESKRHYKRLCRKTDDSVLYTSYKELFYERQSQKKEIDHEIELLESDLGIDIKKTNHSYLSILKKSLQKENAAFENDTEIELMNKYHNILITSTLPRTVKWTLFHHWESLKSEVKMLSRKLEPMHVA